jgi:hypothetical protein
MARRKDQLHQLTLRLPTSLLERVEADAKRVRASLPGLTVSRAHVIRALLVSAIARADASDASREAKA